MLALNPVTGLLLITIFALFLPAAAILQPASRGSIVLEPSYSRIAFDVPISNSTSQFVVANTSLFLLVRKCTFTSTSVAVDSSDFLWLQRDLMTGTTYQVRVSAASVDAEL